MKGNDRIKRGRELLKEFERMIGIAELKALSNLSLEREPTVKESKRMKELAKKLFVRG
jgi:hypothetical protein